MSTGAGGEQDWTESQALVKLLREVKGVDKALGKTYKLLPSPS